MRIRQNRLTKATISRRVTTKDSEGVPVVSYEPIGDLEAEVWYANSKMDAERFGDKITEMLHARIDGAYDIEITNKRNLYVVGAVSFSEGDLFTYKGLDYQITSIVPYPHLKLEAQRI